MNKFIELSSATDGSKILLGTRYIAQAFSKDTLKDAQKEEFEKMYGGKANSIVVVQDGSMVASRHVFKETMEEIKDMLRNEGAMA